MCMCVRVHVWNVCVCVLACGCIHACVCMSVHASLCVRVCVCVRSTLGISRSHLNKEDRFNKSPSITPGQLIQGVTSECRHLD